MLEKLQKIGLSEKESHIYQELAKAGEATANQLARKLSANRTVTYNILQQLINKGLVTYIMKEGKRHFQISSPESLLSSVKEKEEIAKELISEMKNLNNKKEHSQRVVVYEGKEGLRSVFDEIRKAGELLVLNATGLIFEHLEFSARHIVKDIEKHKDVRVIANPSMKGTELAQFKKIKFKYLPKKYENYATTFIFENKVIIQTLTSKPFLVKIESKDIYEGYKKDFELFWSLLG